MKVNTKKLPLHQTDLSSSEFHKKMTLNRNLDVKQQMMARTHQTCNKEQAQTPAPQPLPHPP